MALIVHLHTISLSRWFQRVQILLRTVVLDRVLQANVVVENVSLSALHHVPVAVRSTQLHIVDLLLVLGKLNMEISRVFWSLSTPLITACTQARVCQRDELRYAFVSLFTVPWTCSFGHFRTTNLNSSRRLVKYVTGLLRALRLLGSWTPNMQKCERSSNTKGAFRSLWKEGWFQLVAPTGFSTRNMFPAVSCTSDGETTQPRIVNSAARSLSIRCLTRGELA